MAVSYTVRLHDNSSIRSAKSNAFIMGWLVLLMLARRYPFGLRTSFRQNGVGVF